MKTPAEVLKFAEENKVRMVDLRFMDLPGLWQHFTVPFHQVSKSSFEDGFGFDGSSIRGFQAINESDMLVVPDASTAFLDPFTAIPTLVLNAFVRLPLMDGEIERFTHIDRALLYAPILIGAVFLLLTSSRPLPASGGGNG